MFQTKVIQSEARQIMVNQFLKKSIF